MTGADMLREQKHECARVIPAPRHLVNFEADHSVAG